VLTLIKVHAFGNDFLLVDETSLPPGIDRRALARRTCDRHRGLGADGLITFRSSGFERMGSGHDSAGPDPGAGSVRVAMALLNADGSYSEISGNGVRCLATWVAEQARLAAGGVVEVETDAGTKRLELLSRGPDGLVFRAAMGQPEAVTTAQLDVDGDTVDVVTLRVGNPQCVVLGEVTVERLHRVASRLAVHEHFPHGTNVELATVEAPGRVRILIWERGVGPTEASGTGACAAAVAAMTYGGADRDVAVVAPGGTQRVEWRADGLYLTGSAEIIAASRWMRAADPVE
jgi:diaminopimelate epimerase